MSGLLIEACDWTAEQQHAVRNVEMMLMQRAIKHYPSTLTAAMRSSTGVPSPADIAARGELLIKESA